ncbi:MAG: Ig-like domain-containing protein [Candidatus Entotheonellia bacterium]
MNRRSLLSTTATLLRQALAKTFRCRWMLFFTLLVLLLSPARLLAAGVQALFNLETPTGGPFPCDLFTVADSSHNTGLRVNLPLPDCQSHPSDCDDLHVINTLDGFNQQPRLSIPFSGPIDVTTATSEAVLLISLGSTLSKGNSGGEVVGINQLVWDPETHTLHVESDELLAQHTRYALLVTNGLRDPGGGAVEASEAFAQFRHDLNFGQTKDPALKTYGKALQEGLAAAATVGVPPADIVAASVFTTQSVTAVLEKIRAQLKAAIPEPADFLLGPGGTRTVFARSVVTSILFNQQVGANPSVFSPVQVFLGALPVSGPVGTLAFGKYRSPDYETSDQFIPPVGTRSGVPAVQGENEIFFNLFLPTGPTPAEGWPVVIYGHGGGGSKQTAPFAVAASLAAKGLATIAINAVGNGRGPEGTLTVSTSSGSVTFPAGGRGIDQNNDGNIGALEGLNARLPRSMIHNRDGLRQTVVDLMQLVRVIEVGVDTDGDGVPDLDPTRIYGAGISLGGIYGTLLLAVEPSVRAGVPNVPGGAFIEAERLGSIRPSVGGRLAARVPSLINVGGTEFNENMPLRNQDPVINDVPGAMAIQQFLEHWEWVSGSANAVAYAVHLQKDPLDGIPVKPVILQFAKGDKTHPNPTSTAMLRAGDLAGQATYYRNDLAFAMEPAVVPKDPHLFLQFNTSSSSLLSGIGLGAQRQIAEFLASDGTLVIDPDGSNSLFEVPIVPPLPEELNFIP